MRKTRILPLMLAGLLQAMPMLRAVLPAQAQALAPCSWAFVLKLAAGTVALLGSHHAVSGATTMVGPFTINGTVAQPYARQLGTSGQTAHSWSANTAPKGSVVYPLWPGLYLTNSTGKIGGTPTRAGTTNVTITAWENAGNTGASLSSVFTITIASAPPGTLPAITGPPTDQAVTAGASAVFSVTATGAATLRYVWKFNGTNIARATNTTLQVNAVQPSDAGAYTVIVTNLYGAATNSATLTVTAATPPEITGQPQSQIVPAGANVTLRVSASGSELLYQWSLNGTNLPGATADVLELGNVSPDQSGLYAVAVSNGGGSVLSSNAQLLVVPMPAPELAPQIAFGSTSDGQLLLSFPAAPGYGYALQYNNSLGSTNWITITNVPPSFEGATIGLSQSPADGPLRFYRVLMGL
jgi:hypothetical protein